MHELGPDCIDADYTSGAVHDFGDSQWRAAVMSTVSTTSITKPSLGFVATRKPLGSRSLAPSTDGRSDDVDTGDEREPRGQADQDQWERRIGAQGLH